MVFKTKPFRQSAFLSSESISVSRAETQGDVVDFLGKLKQLATCINCVVNDNGSVTFGANGQLILKLYGMLPAEIAWLVLTLDRSKTPEGTAVGYNISAVGLTGQLRVLPSTDQAARCASMLRHIPVHQTDVITLSASNVTIHFLEFYVTKRSIVRNLNMIAGYPSVNSLPTSRWFLPFTPTTIWYGFFFNSTDGKTATVTYRERGRVTATFSTTSTSTTVAGVTRVYDDIPWWVFDRSANAEVKCVYIDTGLGIEPPYNKKSVSARYSTTSTSYVKNTPISVTTVRLKIRKIVVSASPNAKWYVDIDGSTVLNSEWGITSLDFNPPPRAATVDLYLASTDGTTATATIIIIYDEYPVLP